MHTVTDEEVKRDPQTLLDETQRGEITVVTVDGRAVMMALPLVDGVPSEATLLNLAASLYDREMISLGKAARISGLSYSEMIDELGRRDIATIRMGPGELERELAAFGP